MGGAPKIQTLEDLTQFNGTQTCDATHHRDREALDHVVRAAAEEQIGARVAHDHAEHLARVPISKGL